MEEMIIVQLKPTELEHSVYIISNNTEMVPLIKRTTIEELPSVVAMSAAKYNINCIKLAGPHSYTCGVRDQVTAKINTCFGKDNNFLIELM
jgi:hypothetical protein